LRAEAERENKAARSAGASFVALGEPSYPSRLRMIDDAPPPIAVRGHLAIMDRPMMGRWAPATRRPSG
jgi:DNA processing protein